MRGGIDSNLPGTVCFDIMAAVKRRRPGLRMHAFSPRRWRTKPVRTGLPVRWRLARATQAGVGGCRHNG